MLLLVVSIPCIGFLAYRSIIFQYNQLVIAWTSHPCIFTSQDGSEWDLNALSRSPSQCSSSNTLECSDYHLRRKNTNFVLNICNNVMIKPESCREGRVRNSIGYETSDGECSNMGLLQSGKWSLLDERRVQPAFPLTFSALHQPPYSLLPEALAKSLNPKATPNTALAHHRHTPRAAAHAAGRRRTA